MSGTSKVDEIQRDLACPACQYNLRGLRGAVVTCPECGKTSDMARLLASQWTKSLWQVPRFRELETSALVGAWIIPLVALDGLMSYERLRIYHGDYLHCAVLGLLLLWIWTVNRVRRQWSERRGVRLTLLIHRLIPFWYLLIIGPFVGVKFVMDGLQGHMPKLVVAGVVIFCIEAGLYWVCRRARRWIAMRCLRQHLEEASHV